MPRRQRPYVPVDVDIASDPKIMAIGPVDRWMFIFGLTMAKKNRQDGLIYGAQLRLSGVRKPLESARRLIEAGLWRAQGEHFEVVSWLKWNMSEDQLEQLRGERRAAGSEGGKRSGQVRGSQTKQVGSEDEASWFDTSKQDGETIEPTGPDQTGPDQTGPDEDTDQTGQASSFSFEANQRVQAILEAMVGRRFDPQRCRDGNTAAYRRGIEANVRQECAVRVRELVEHSALTDKQIVDKLEGTEQPRGVRSLPRRTSPPEWAEVLP